MNITFMNAMKLAVAAYAGYLFVSILFVLALFLFVFIPIFLYTLYKERRTQRKS